jgi:pyruvate,water dikinase
MRMRDRENLRFERTRVFGRTRRIMRALGDRLVERGLLDDPRDVFWLAREELFGAVEGTSLTSDLRGTVAARKAIYEADRRLPPLPERFETRGPVLPLRPVARMSDAPELPLDDDVRRGLGCCGGLVEGIARVVRDPRGVALEAGEILVAERTDPGWVLLFPAARAVVVERGSLLSHSAIVTREIGIPGVVSLPGAMSWLRNGDRIRVDGGSGEVRILHRAERTS